MTHEHQSRTERKLKQAAAFLFLGLAVQLSTLLVNHPLAFLGFIFVGSPFVLVGALIYLWSVVIHSERTIE